MTLNYRFKIQKKKELSMAGELSSNQLQAAGELEIEMMQDLYKR
jgi:hypothetical protein